ncbi:hypothetical protein GW570_11385 [Clavibacter capsici]|uniref:Uncharacterized protein n=1 Tax=Clavibacter capsici TaxID=1874630 RepID=A0AAE7CDH0_9MICO|nr:hypothetical protein [Clavibacter capsici]QIS45645.1 hypothetical protein GW570_11385 [Clavibacter capsici]
MDSGIQFSSTGPAFQLSGAGVFRLFERIVPLLDGSLSREELRTAAGPRHWPVVDGLLGHLSERGFLRWISAGDVEVVDERDRAEHAEQISFLAQYVDAPHAAFRRFRDAPVHLVGDGPLVDAVAENLRANGHRDVHAIADPSSPDSDEALAQAEHVIVMPTARSYSWFRRRGASLEASRLLLVVPGAGRLWALPHRWAPGAAEGPDWTDAVAALEEAGALAGLHRMLVSADHGHAPLVGRAASVPVQRMMGALLSYEVFKGLTGALPAETATGAVSLDSVTGETASHRVVPSTQRGRAIVVPLRPSASDPARRPRVPSLRDSRADEYDAWREAVGPITMPVTGFDDADLTQLPMKVGVAVTTSGARRASSSMWTAADARMEAVARCYEDLVAELEPATGRVALATTGDGSIAEVPAGAVFRRSRANSDGRHDRSAAAVAVALTAEAAVDRAVDGAVAEALLLDAVRRPSGTVFPLRADDAASTFIRDIAPGISCVHLGSVEVDGHGELHVAVAHEERDGLVVWHAAVGASPVSAAVSAASEVVAQRQHGHLAPETASMRLWSGVDPRALVGGDGTGAARRAEVAVGLLEAPLLVAAGLVAATAVVVGGVPTWTS